MSKSLTLLLHGIVDTPSDDTFLSHLKCLNPLVQRSRCEIVDQPALRADYELGMFGLVPGSFQIQNGEILASAFRQSPPLGTLCFVLSLCLLDSESRISEFDQTIRVDELQELGNLLARLDSQQLQSRMGLQSRHMLFWLGAPQEFYTQEPCGQKLAEAWPDGERSKVIRQFIDDSANLLMETELNKRRLGEGESTIDILWPWGQGIQKIYPNLPLRRGKVASVLSGELTWAGLSRIFGYQHLGLENFARPLNPNFRELYKQAQSLDCVQVHFHQFSEVIEKHRFEEGVMMFNELYDKFLEPLLRAAFDHIHIYALSNSGPDGIALHYDSERPQDNYLPFDERLFEERLITRQALHESLLPIFRP